MPTTLRFSICVFLLTLMFSASAYSAQQSLVNQLKDHPAPYLELHGNDPVAWQQWNAKTLARAQAENKIIFVSVGYFACHWCHVMQQESYQDEGVAEFINEHFIKWHVPHFEKMLYDNANLSLLYLKAFDVIGDAQYQKVALDTLEFMRRDMWHRDGALVASFSAVDDASIEGGSYLWELDEVEELLSPEQARLITTLWDLDSHPDLPAGDHPKFVVSLDEYAQSNNLTQTQAQSIFDKAKQKLITARRTRSLPVDDKLLAAWNALSLSAFITAYQQTGDKKFLDTAQALRDFVRERLWNGVELSRAIVKGEILGNASLEDYAYVARALSQWAELTDSEDDRRWVRRLVDQGWERFYRNNAWYSGDGSLLAPTSGED